MRTSSGLTLVPDQRPRRGSRPAHPARPRRPRHPATPDPRADRLAARARPARRAPGLRLHRRHPARRGGPPGRPPGDDPLGVLRQARPRLPGRRGRPGPDLRTRRARRHLGGRHRRHRPRPRPRRGGPRPGGRADHRPPPGRLPAPARATRPSSAPSSPPRPPSANRCARSSSGSPSTPAPTSRVESLAARARLSPRHFARAFQAETGTTPGRYVDRVRLEHARRLLEDTADGVEEIARACGYGTPEAMRRAFVRALGTAPAEYRRRFRHRPSTHLKRTPSTGRTPCRSPSSSSTASPPWTPWARTRSSAALPGAETVFVAERTGPVRTDTGSPRAHRRQDPRRGAEPRHRGGSRRPRPDRADGERGPPRLAARRRRHQHLDDLRVHRLPAARRRRTPRGPPRHLALAGPGPPRSSSAPSRPGSGSCSTASTSPPPVSPPASTWVSPCSAGSRATNTPRPYSC